MRSRDPSMPSGFPNDRTLTESAEAQFVHLAWTGDLPRRVREVADTAQVALLGLQGADVGFLRSSEQMATGEPPTEFFPTVSFQSLLSLANLKRRHPEWLSEDVTDFLTSPAAESLWVEARKPLAESSFRIVATSLQLTLLAEHGVDTEAMTNHLLKLASDLETLHPYLIAIIDRALLTVTDSGAQPTRAAVMEFITAQQASCEAVVRSYLANEALGTARPGDEVAVVFAGEVLSRQMDGHSRPLVREVLRIATQYQQVAGSWPFGRVLTGPKDIDRQRVEVLTADVARALARITVNLLSHPDAGMRVLASSNDALGATLLRSLEFIERSKVTVTVPRVGTQTETLTGWSGDHEWHSSLVESWATAIALDGALAVNAALEHIVQERVLNTFVTLRPTDANWPAFLRWPEYRETGEISEDKPILTFLDAHFVQPRLRTGATRATSLLLFGPPGTSKTTIVKGIADGLGWPLVMLSPGDFIVHGLEMIEAQARDVFQRLMRLDRTVVLFDECDELFRFRSPSEASEQNRSISAFVTASMLPKIQELHDSGQVIFAICTNLFETMDLAVKRDGRVDYSVAVGPPTGAAALRIAEAAFADALGDLEVQSPHDNEAVMAFSAQAAGLTRGEIKRAMATLARRCQDDGGWENTHQAQSVAKGLATEAIANRLIEAENLARFEASREKYCAVIAEYRSAP